jgi:hypothetical protein
MSERYLLFDGGCSVCAALAREVEALSGGRLGVRNLRDPEIQVLLNRARPGWRWEPMLLEIERERVRVFAGLAMRMRLLQILGPARALRVAQAVARMGGPVLGVDWGRRRLLQQGGALAALALLRRLPGGSPMARPEKDPPTPPATGAGELWEGFVLLPEGAPIPPFVTCAPAPILCQTDGSPEAEALRGEILPVQDLNEARARSSLPLYQPVGMPLHQGRIIRFQQGGSVFSVMLDFGLKEPEVRLWARPIYPRPYPIWPVRHPDQPERLIQPEKISFTPAPGVLLPTADGYMVQWIERSILYTLLTHHDPDGSSIYKIAQSLARL